LATCPALGRETETLVEVRLLRPQQDQQDRPEVVELTGIRVPGQSAGKGQAARVGVQGLSLLLCDRSVSG
jgi:hypothetical protein